MDPFATQVASYYAGTEYQRGQLEQAVAPGDKTMRDIAMAAYVRKDHIDGFDYVPGLSTDETAVYIQPRSRQAVVSFRGSVTKEDWLKTDVALAKGRLTETARFNRSRQELIDAKNALHGYDVYTTGHSMGGTLSDNMTNVEWTKGNVSFNSGKGLQDAIPERYKPDKYKTPKARSYLNRRDYVSMAGNETDNNVYYSKGYLNTAHRPNPTRWSNHY